MRKKLVSPDELLLVLQLPESVLLQLLLRLVLQQTHCGETRISLTELGL